MEKIAPTRYQVPSSRALPNSGAPNDETWMCMDSIFLISWIRFVTL